MFFSYKNDSFFNFFSRFSLFKKINILDYLRAFNIIYICKLFKSVKIIRKHKFRDFELLFNLFYSIITIEKYFLQNKSYSKNSF